MGKAIYYGGGSQFFDDAGDPLNLGKLYTYEPGSTTPMATYKESALSNAHTNPIILDAYGRPPSGQIWFTGNTKLLAYNRFDVLVPLLGGDNLNPDVTGLGQWSTKNAGVLTKSADYTVVAADDGKMIISTANDWTLALPSAATVGDGFVIEVLNASSDVMTVNPAGSQTVNGALTAVFHQWNGGVLRCDGINWRLTRSGADYTFAKGSVAPLTASLEFTSLAADVRGYRLTFSNLRPTADSVNLIVRLDSNNGASYDAGASDYSWVITTLANLGVTHTRDELDTGINLTTGAMDNGFDGSIAGEILILYPGDANGKTQLLWSLSCIPDSGFMTLIMGAGQFSSLAAHNAMQLYFSGTTLNEMEYALTTIGGAP